MTVFYGVPRGRRRDDPEDQLAAALSLLPSPLCDFTRQHPYVPGRKFAADFAWPAQRVIVEINGGVWSGQAHGSISGILRDNERGNLAALEGYRVLRFVPDAVKDESLAETLATIEAALLVI